MRQDKLPPAVNNGFLCRPTMIALMVGMIWSNRTIPTLLVQREGWNVVPERMEDGMIRGNNVLVSRAQSDKADRHFEEFLYARNTFIHDESTKFVV